MEKINRDLEIEIAFKSGFFASSDAVAREIDRDLNEAFDQFRKDLETVRSGGVISEMPVED